MPLVILILSLLALPAPSGAEVVADDIGVLAIRMVELHQQQRNAEALPLARRAVDLAEDTLGADHPTVAIYLEFLARVHRALGHTDEAKDVSARAAGIRAASQDGTK